MTVSIRIRTAATAVLGAAATALALAAPAQAAVTAPPPARPLPVLVGCQGGGHVTPRHYVIACADDGIFLVRMHWSTWRSTAAARGDEWVNNCKPNCAEGHFYRYPVQVTLQRPRSWPRHPGQQYFTRMTVTYPRTVPVGFRRTETFTLSPTA